MSIRSVLNLPGFLFLTMIAGLSACGGSSSDGATSGVTTATGVFKDSNVSGMEYVSGSQTGVTGTDGKFTYEVGQPVTFSVGGVTLGTATGKAMITPLDLVSGGTSNSLQVQNIIRFLIMLDSNGDPSDGISISSPVQTIAQTWAQVNFAAADLGTELASVISDVDSADGASHTLPDATTAQSHMVSTLMCTHAGAFRGTFSGDDSGPFGMLVSAQTGLVSGFAYSDSDQVLVALTGTTPIGFDQTTTAFVTGNASFGATFDGQFTSPDQISGNWSSTQPTGSGTFSGNRIGGVAEAVYRFTGGYGGDDSGLFAFDVDVDDKVTGVAYSVDSDELFTLTGAVSGTSLSATTSGGAAVTGTLNKTTGALTGTWTNATQGDAGTFVGSGCRLN